MIIPIFDLPTYYNIHLSVCIIIYLYAHLILKRALSRGAKGEFKEDNFELHFLHVWPIYVGSSILCINMSKNIVCTI